MSQKRYRYTGMERDDETGMALHGVRLYAAWLGRWVRCDPIGMRGGLNRFEYARSSPMMASDRSGLNPLVLPARDEQGVEGMGPVFDARNPPPETVDISTSMRQLLKSYGRNDHFGSSYDTTTVWREVDTYDPASGQPRAEQDITLRLRAGIEPSFALDQMRGDNPAHPDLPEVDCRCAVAVAAYMAVRDVVGEDAFNKMIGEMDLGFGLTSEADIPVEVMFERTEVSVADFIANQHEHVDDDAIVYFSNDFRYLSLADKPNYWAGEWTVYDAETASFLGHPFGNENVTAEEVLDRLKISFEREVGGKLAEMRRADPDNPMATDPWGGDHLHAPA